MSKVSDFLPPAPKEELVPVQGYVPKDLRQEVIDQMQRDKKSGVKLTWDSLLAACLRSYLSEKKPKRASS